MRVEPPPTRGSINRESRRVAVKCLEGSDRAGSSVRLRLQQAPVAGELDEADAKTMDDPEHEHAGGEIPEGVGPEVFREHLEQVSRQHAGDGAHITVENEDVYLEDIQEIEPESVGGRSRIRLRNGVIIGGLTGAAIVAALATVRYRRRHRTG